MNDPTGTWVDGELVSTKKPKKPKKKKPEPVVVETVPVVVPRAVDPFVAEQKFASASKYKKPKTPWHTWPVFYNGNTANGTVCELSPATVKKALDNFASDTRLLPMHLTENGINPVTFRDIRKNYPEVQAYYEESWKLKAHQFGSAAMEVFQHEIPAQYWQSDREGNKIPTSAGVKFLESKSNMLLRMAEIHEERSYKRKTHTENKSVSLNVNANVDIDLNDLHDLPLDALLKPDD